MARLYITLTVLFVVIFFNALMSFKGITEISIYILIDSLFAAGYFLVNWIYTLYENDNDKK